MSNAEPIDVLVVGAGAAGIACIELVKSIGFLPETVILCDTKGVVYQGREDGMNQWKSAHAAKTDARSLADALDGADIVFGLGSHGAPDAGTLYLLAQAQRTMKDLPAAARTVDSLKTAFPADPRGAM